MQRKVRLKQRFAKNKKKETLKGMMTLEMSLLILIIMGILYASITVSLDLYRQCEENAQISGELKVFQAAETFRKAQAIQKTAGVLTHQ